MSHAVYPQTVYDDVAHVLIDEATLHARVKELGAIIAREYANQDLLLISVLKGSFIFMADLVRAMPIPHEVDFLVVSSYGAGTKSSGVVQILKDLSQPIDGRNVVVVEDIIDSGNTLSYLLRSLQQRSPASIRVMTLLDKPDRREVPIDIDWTGFVVPDEFVIGYGLDYDGIYRNLPFIGVLKPSVYTESTDNPS